MRKAFPPELLSFVQDWHTIRTLLLIPLFPQLLVIQRIFFAEAPRVHLSAPQPWAMRKTIWSTLGALSMHSVEAVGLYRTVQLVHLELGELYHALGGTETS